MSVCHIRGYFSYTKIQLFTVLPKVDAEADAIFTSDDDFYVLDLKRPMIISPADFLRGV